MPCDIKQLHNHQWGANGRCRDCGRTRAEAEAAKRQHWDTVYINQGHGPCRNCGASAQPYGQPCNHCGRYHDWPRGPNLPPVPAPPPRPGAQAAPAPAPTGGAQPAPQPGPIWQPPPPPGGPGSKYATCTGCGQLLLPGVPCPNCNKPKAAPRPPPPPPVFDPPKPREPEPSIAWRCRDCGYRGNLTKVDQYCRACGEPDPNAFVRIKRKRFLPF